MHSRGAVVVLMILLATTGCTDDPAPQGQTASQTPSTQGQPQESAFAPDPFRPSPSGPSAPVASPSRSGERISVSPTDVAGVRVGTAAEETEQQLTKALGRPVVEPLPGCFSETGKSLTWDALTAYLSDGGDGGPVVLSGWTVVSGPNSQRVTLPYGTAVGQRSTEVMSKVPAAEGEVVTEGPYAESFLVTTPKAPGLLWRADAEGAVVDEAAYEPEVCD